MTIREQSPIGSGFAAKSEPAEVLAGIDLSGRTAIVTGGYSGIGLETTRALAGSGATVTVPARSMDKATAALQGIDGVTIMPMDLGAPDSVRAFAAEWTANHGPLDLLINNAGIMACPEGRVGPGWETQFGTNHMGHFILTSALLPALEAAAAPRVVALTSSGHRLSAIRWDDPDFRRDGYDKWQAYGQSKTANALFALALDARLRGAGGRAFSVHPGGILTPLQRHLPSEEMQALGWLDADGNLSARAAAVFKTPSQGCTTTLWAATAAELVNYGGEFCEDCDIAQAVDGDSSAMHGVRPWARDTEAAERLWSLSEDWASQA